MTTVRAKVRKGRLRPVRALPARWKAGDEIELHGDRVKRTAAEIDAAWAEIHRLAQETGDEEHWRKVEATLAENDRLVKERMRREMGLSE